MIYRFNPTSKELDKLQPANAADAGVTEGEIEKALAGRPEALFRASVDGPPVLVVKKSVPFRRMADIIALDSEGRLILVECKRGWATRDSLAQLLDYASDYHDAPYRRLQEDWRTGDGRDTEGTLLDHVRRFSDDPSVEEADVGREHVLVVVAAARDDTFEKVAEYLRSRGVEVYFVPVRLFRRSNGELFLDVEPIRLDPSKAGSVVNESRVWMINTDETHSTGALARFHEEGVAAVWGYPDGPATLRQGAAAGDAIYAYQNGRGIVARGRVKDGEVYQSPPEESVFPECHDGNEWHMRVEWAPLPPGSHAISNAEVRQHTGGGLPVRNTFCRLWNQKVRSYLATRWTGASAVA